MERTLSAVVFDMDGVIFDSERATFHCWQAVMGEAGYPDITRAYRLTIGVNAALAREIFLEQFGPDLPYDALAKEASARYHARYDGGRLPLKPGVRALLERLRDWDCPAYVASSTRRAVVARQLEDAGLLGFFRGVTGGDQVAKSKPEPDIFLAAVAGDGLAPARCAVIEDSYNGVRAASRAGMTPIMVPDMLPANDEMRTLAAAILPDLTAAGDFLRERFFPD